MSSLHTNFIIRTYNRIVINNSNLHPNVLEFFAKFVGILLFCVHNHTYDLCTIKVRCSHNRLRWYANNPSQLNIINRKRGSILYGVGND